MGRVDISSVCDCFPSGITPQGRFVRLLEWISESDYTRLLTPDFCGDRMDDFWIENGSLLDRYFCLFLQQGDGTRVGFWFYKGCEVERAPIVILGSGSRQDEVKVIADSVEDFAVRIVEGRTGIYELDNALSFEEESSFSQWLQDLGNWLESTWGITPAIRAKYAVDSPAEHHPVLEKWLGDWSDRQIVIQRKNPICQKISSILIKYFPDTDAYLAQITSDPEGQVELRTKANSKGYLPWLTANFDVFIVGTKFEIRRRSRKGAHVAESAQLEPLFRQLRIARAIQTPEQGLWFTARVKVDSEGTVLICRDDDYSAPDFQEERPTIDDYKQDLADFPRSPEYIPQWLSNYEMTQSSSS